MAQRSVATICANDAAGGGVDRRHLFVRHQYASGTAGAGGTVQGSGRQRCCQPHLAEGADGLAGHGVIVRWLRRMLSVSSWMARWSGCGSTAKRRRYRCWWRWAYGVMARRCCWRCATWVVKARLPGAVLLDDLVSRGLQPPSFVIIDGAAGLEKAVGLVWPDTLMQRCTVHKHRNLLAHAPERLHEEVSADYNDMIYAGTPKEIEKRRKSFIRKWRLKCRAVADSLEEAGDRLFTFARLPDSQWRSARTTN